MCGGWHNAETCEGNGHNQSPNREYVNFDLALLELKEVAGLDVEPLEAVPIPIQIGRPGVPVPAVQRQPHRKDLSKPPQHPLAGHDQLAYRQAPGTKGGGEEGKRQQKVKFESGSVHSAARKRIKIVGRKRYVQHPQFYQNRSTPCRGRRSQSSDPTGPSTRLTPLTANTGLSEDTLLGPFPVTSPSLTQYCHTTITACCPGCERVLPTRSDFDGCP